MLLSHYQLFLIETITDSNAKQAASKVGMKQPVLDLSCLRFSIFLSKKKNKVRLFFVCRVSCLEFPTL